MVEPYTAGKKRKSVSVSKFYLFDIAVARTLQNISVPYEGNEEFGARIYKISRDGKEERLTNMKITGG